jgi:simple sugar transport system ATP-binding protein
MVEDRAAIRLEAVEKSFDGVPALRQADYSAQWGELHCLLGENGAGKTTLMNVPGGLYRPDKGRVFIDGKQVEIGGPNGARMLGIGMVHQHFKLVRPFTVVENIMLGNPRDNWKTNMRKIVQKIKEIDQKLGFETDPNARIDTLSVAEQQRVEIIKVLVAGARILILDEPTAVLTDEEADRLLTVMRDLAHAGQCVITITHKLHEALRFADQITVMRGGKIVASVRPKATDKDELTRLMVGSSLAKQSAPSKRSGEVCVRCENLNAIRDDGKQTVNGLDLEIRTGEIFGVAGVGGNGQTELAEILMGVRKPTSGNIFLRSLNITSASPRKRRKLGLVIIAADRYAHGLAGDLSITDNFTVVALQGGGYGSAFWINRKAMTRNVREAIDGFEIHGATPSGKARLLSGGNAQKLVLAREISIENKSFVMAHLPTRGLDVRAYAAVHQHLRDARDSGAAVLLISEDLDEVLGLSNRVGVLNRGRIVGIFDSPVDRQRVGELMVGHA